jgi:benzylsuccinate CoA-transferase BbsF subunit
MAALDYRRRTGKGQHIDQSQFESSVEFFASPVMDYQINGRILSRNGNRLPAAAPHGVYQCKGDDNWVAISVMDEDQWKKFGPAIGNPELANNKDYISLELRKKNEDALDKLVTDWTMTHTHEEVESILQKAGIPSNIVEKPSDIYKDPQLASRKYFTSLEHQTMGNQKYVPQACYILSKTPRNIDRPSPCVGEHNEYVFKDLLQMSDEEIADHLIDGSITTEFVGRITSSF